MFSTHTLRQIAATFTAAVVILAACSGGGGDYGATDSPATPKDPKIQITSPTTAPSLSVASGFVLIAGAASIDAYSASDWAPRIRWSNMTTGMQGAAFETVEWVWLFSYYPTNHRWSANVPLVGGSNQIVVEAHYPGGFVAGVDSILVTAPPDTTPPSIQITAPTTEPLLTLQSAFVDIAGVADDDRMLLMVEWRNTTTGEHGTAVGTSSWAATVPLVFGSNTIAVTTRDGDGNTAQDSINVFRDNTVPGLVIGAAAISATDSAQVALTGTAADAGGLARVTWRNATNGTSGTAEGTVSWMALVPVQLGANVITLTVEDLVGNTETASTSFEVNPEAAGFGANESGQLGTGTATTAPISCPVMTALQGVRKIVGGARHALALMNDGSVRSWGNGTFGVLGTGSTLGSATPTRVPDLPSIRDVDVAGDYSIALSSEGTVYYWGGWPNRLTPVPVAGLPRVSAIAAGPFHYVVLLADGTVRSVSGADQQDPGLSEVVTIAAGFNYSVALRADGTTWAWGLANIAEPPLSPTPVPVLGLRVIRLGRGGSSAIAEDGQAWKFVPQGGSLFAKRIPNLDSVVALDIREGSGVALRHDGTVWTWRERAWYSCCPSALADIEFSPLPSAVRAVTKATDVTQGVGFTLLTRGP